MVSIIILTHDAPEYVERTLTSLQKTEMVDYEVIVLDNASGKETKELLWKLYGQGMIDKLIFEKENTFFSRGNNLAANFCDKKSDYILLLNSDVEIKNPLWLKKMFEIHQQGITSIGGTASSEGNVYADGWCFLIDKKLYLENKMEEKFEFSGALPEVQVKLIEKGKNVQFVKKHEELIHHYGGKSGVDYKKAKGMEAPRVYNIREKKAFKKIKVVYSLSEKIGCNIQNANFKYGISEDLWCAKDIDFELKTWRQGKIYIKGYFPFEITGKQRLNFYVNNKKKQEKIQITESEFAVTLDAPMNEIVSVRIKANFSYPAQPPDVRQLAFILSDIKGL